MSQTKGTEEVRTSQKLKTNSSSRSSVTELMGNMGLCSYNTLHQLEKLRQQWSYPNPKLKTAIEAVSYVAFGDMAPLPHFRTKTSLFRSRFGTRDPFSVLTINSDWALFDVQFLLFNYTAV